MGEVKQNICNDRHVAVLAFPFATHAAPLLAVVRRLSASSPTTHFSFFNTAQSNQSIFSSEPNNQLPNISARRVSDGVPDGYVSVGKPQEHIELFLNSAPSSFREGIKQAEAEIGRKVSCLMTDAFFWFAAEMATEMEVPWIPFWTAGPDSLSAHVHTDFLRKSYGIEGIAGKEKELLNLIPGMSKVKIRDLPEGIVFDNLESVFSCMLQKMGAVLAQADAVFLNSFEELDLTMTNDLKSKFKKHLNIGPLNLISPSPSDDPYGCIPWLDQQKVGSAAYVSFGSVTTPPPHEIAALAEGLEASGVPFIWSLRENAKVHLPNGFLNNKALNGMIVPWAPQLEILGHGGIGVFVTHGGWNSLMESVGGGVPLICRPFFGDQRLNGRMVEDVWEIGVIVEGGVLTKQGVVNGLDQITSRERGKKLRDNIKVLKELAIKAIEPKGSSTKNFLALSQLVFWALMRKVEESHLVGFSFGVFVCVI